MNNEQQQIIDEVYRDYALSCIKETKKQEKEMKEKGEWLTLCLTPYFENKDKFIELIKTDSKLSEKWGLKIEERELRLDERCDWLNKNYPMFGLGNWTIEKISDIDYLKEVEYEYEVPTKLITITYDNETIESYE